MELLVLILANILTAFVMYFLFSMKFSSALEKAKNTPISREFYKVIKETLAEMNSIHNEMEESRKIMDERTRHVRSLVQRAEDLLNEIDKKKSGKKTDTKKSKDIPLNNIIDTPSSKAQKNAFKTDDGSSQATDDYIERLLQSTGDRIDLSNTPPVNQSEDRVTASPNKNQGEGVLSWIGKQVRKGLGIPDIPDLPVAKQETKEAYDFAAAVQKEIQQLKQKEANAKKELPKKNIANPSNLNPSSREDSFTFAEESFSYNRNDDKDRMMLSPEAERMLQLDSIIKSYGNYADATTRARLIRELLDAGYSTAEIRKAARLSQAEIDLVASLPGTASKIRRERVKV